MSIKLPSQNVLVEFKEKVKKHKYFNFSLESDNLQKNHKNFSKEDREKIVVLGQSGKYTIGEVCLENNITPVIFYQWTQEFLANKKDVPESQHIGSKYFSDDDKYRIVLEGNNGELSIAEICRIENITHDQFLRWSSKFMQIRKKRILREFKRDNHTSRVRDLILEHAGKDVLSYFESFIDVTSIESKVFRDSSGLNGQDKFENIQNLVCLSKINNIRYINKYFELINSKLPIDGVFIGCLESFSARRLRKNINKFPVINEIYFGGEFFIKRILPKLDLTKKYYFNFTKGKDRLMSKAEGLGRLVSCGFKIIDFKNINGLVYFVVKKEKNPSFDLEPSYGPIYKMPRLGKNGRIIKVYKFRTMHPYSEYLQDYILKAHGYANTGKPANDFRIPAWGKIMRKFWLDELPQLINVLKGEMKLVGIRPVSKRYFQDIPVQMQKLRLTQKPGCIPPYVALNRNGDVISVLQAEKDYLEEKIKNPYTTDTKYFFKAISNILLKHKRSA